MFRGHSVSQWSNFWHWRLLPDVSRKTLKGRNFHRRGGHARLFALNRSVFIFGDMKRPLHEFLWMSRYHGNPLDERINIDL